MAPSPSLLTADVGWPGGQAAQAFGEEPVFPSPTDIAIQVLEMSSVTGTRDPLRGVECRQGSCCLQLKFCQFG